MNRSTKPVIVKDDEEEHSANTYMERPQPPSTSGFRQPAFRDQEDVYPWPVPSSSLDSQIWFGSFYQPEPSLQWGSVNSAEKDRVDQPFAERPPVYVLQSPPMPVSMTTSFDDEPLATQQPRPPFPATFASNDEFGTGEYPPSKDAPKSKRSRENSEDKCNFDHQEDDVCNGSQTDFHSEYETDSSDSSPRHKRRKTSIPHCEYHCPDMQEKFNGPYAHAVVTSCQYKQSTPKKIRFHKLYRDIEDASACVARWVWRQYCKYEDGDEEEALEILERRGPVEERGWYTPRDWKGMEFGAWVQSMPLE